MTHVRVEGLTSGYHQKDATEGQEGEAGLREHEIKAMRRIDRSDHTGLFHDLRCSQNCKGYEPNDHYRAEQKAESSGPTVLVGKEKHQYHCRDHEDPRLETGHSDLEALNG